MKVKCKDCGTVILINDPSDLIWEPFISYEGACDLKCFEINCPYCNTRFLLRYNANKKITKWINKMKYDMNNFKQNNVDMFKTIIDRKSLITVYTKMREDDYDNE